MRLFIPAILLTTCLLSAVRAESTAASGAALFEEARKVSESDLGRGRAGYEAAALAYLEEAGRSHIQQGMAQYNAGNAFALAGRPGRAIAAYRRAQRDLPGMSYLDDNLAHVRNLAGTPLSPPNKLRLRQQLMCWHQAHWGLRLGGLALSYLLLWGLLLSCQWRGKPGPRRIILSLSLLCLILAGSLLHHLIDTLHRNEGVVVVARVEARKGDGYGYQPAFLAPLRAGSEFKLIQTKGAWLLVSLGDGSHGWLPEEAVELF